MANPFYTGGYSAPQYNSQPNNINDIYRLLSNSKNPMQVFENIAKNNPNMAPILNLLHNGYSPEQIFVTMCQQRGIDPKQFMQNITR